MEPELLVRLLRFSSIIIPKQSDLRVVFSLDEFDELMTSKVIEKVVFPRACTSPGCSLDIVSEVENENEIILVCEDHHQIACPKQTIESNRRFKINYSLLVITLFKEIGYQNIPSSSVQFEKGVLAIQSSEELLILVPGEYTKSSEDLICSRIVTTQSQQLVFIYDDKYRERLSVLANYYYAKLLGFYSTSGFSDPKTLTGIIKRKKEVLNSLGKVVGQANCLTSSSDKSNLILNPQLFIAKLLDLYKTEDYELFEDYAKVALGTLCPMYFGGGAKSRGVRISDSMGLILNEGKPIRRLILDAKSIRSLKKSKVKVDAGTASKYAHYLDKMKELSERMGEAPVTLLFIAPQFTENRDELNSEIRKSFRGYFDLCFMDLDALSIIYFAFSNPLSRADLLNRINVEKFISTIFDAAEIQKQFGISVINHAYSLTLNDVENILKQVMGSEEKYAAIFSEYQKLCQTPRTQNTV